MNVESEGDRGTWIIPKFLAAGNGGVLHEAAETGPHESSLSLSCLRDIRRAKSDKGLDVQVWRELRLRIKAPSPLPFHTRGAGLRELA